MVLSINRQSFLKCWPSLLLLGLFSASLPVEGGVKREIQDGYRESKLEAKANSKRSRPRDGPVFEPKIVGGSDSAEDAYPWMAGLLERGEDDRFFAQFCGGALIHPYWVLTAAHCVEDATPDEIDVLIGSVDLGNASQGERIPVVEIIMHPDYDPISFDGDAALLRLATPSTAPVLRVNSDTLVEMPGLIATVIGWGALDADGNNYPEVLQEAQLPLVDFSTANAIWEDTLTSNMIAAGNLSQGGVDSCSGDSGGPLLVRDFDGAWTLAGLTSFGDGCAMPNSPGIYTRVSQIRPWLLNIISPKYASWELVNDVLGESRDSDGDLRTNFEEFAFGTNPSLVDLTSLAIEMDSRGPAFTFRRPAAANAELSYAVNYWTELTDSPTELDLDTRIWESISDGDEEIIRAGFPSGNSGFISMAAERPEALAHAVRLVAFPGRAFSTMNADVREDTFGRSYQEFTFPGQPLGEPVRYLAESGSLDVALEIYDASGTTILAAADLDSAVGGDEELTYTATSIPVIRVLGSNGLGGEFSLTGYTEVASDGQILLNSTINDALTDSDDLDDLFELEYYKRDYLLVLPDGYAGPVTITLLSDDVDPYLTLLNALTGDFIDDNDDIDLDGGNFNARVEVDTSVHSDILIRVSTSFELETGAFTLTANEGGI
jgi:hypothetical protein